MISKLNVELYGTVLGSLSRNEKWFDFTVDTDVFAKYQIASTIMSLAVPLNLRYTNAQKKRCANFFAELLPEGRNFEWLAQTLPRDDRTLYGMLRKYGRDIAGALIIYDPEDPASSESPCLEPVDGVKIKYLLENMPQAALASELTSWKCDELSNESEAITFIRNCLERCNSALHKTPADDRGYPKLKEEISLFISNLLLGKRIG